MRLKHHRFTNSRTNMLALAFRHDELITIDELPVLYN